MTQCAFPLSCGPWHIAGLDIRTGGTRRVRLRTLDLVEIAFHGRAGGGCRRRPLPASTTLHASACVSDFRCTHPLGGAMPHTCGGGSPRWRRRTALGPARRAPGRTRPAAAKHPVGAPERPGRDSMIAVVPAKIVLSAARRAGQMYRSASPLGFVLVAGTSVDLKYATSAVSEIHALHPPSERR